MTSRSLRCALVAATSAALLLGGCGRSEPKEVGPGTPRATTAVAPSPTPACVNRDRLATWSVQKLAQQTVVIPVNESNVATITPLVAAGAGGVILFGSSAPANLGQAVAQLVSKAPDGIPPFVMSDEEGGSVQRLPNVVGTLPSARQVAATMTPAEIQQLGQQVGTKLKSVGVNMDLAPVLDLDDRPGPSDANPDGTRSYSIDPAVASAAGIAFAKGLASAGVVPVVKHFPGLGGATGNTDTRSASSLPWTTLEKTGLLPFEAAVQAGLPAVMIMNATIPGLTDVPATISPEVITGVLRERLKFNGLVMTDSLSAVSIRMAGFSVRQASALAIKAGSDMVLYNGAQSQVANTNNLIVQSMVDAVNQGGLSRARLEEAVDHILTAKGINLCTR